MVSLQFLGGAGTTTGSKHLITTDDTRVLIDCGLFQGLKELRLRNWQPFPIGPHAIQALILTHAHIDHSGYLPRFVKYGFAGPVYATAATCDLAAIMLRDSAHTNKATIVAPNSNDTNGLITLPVASDPKLIAP